MIERGKLEPLFSQVRDQAECGELLAIAVVTISGPELEDGTRELFVHREAWHHPELGEDLAADLVTCGERIREDLARDAVLKSST